MKKILILILIGFCYLSFSQTFTVVNENGENIEGVLFYSNNKNINSNKRGLWIFQNLRKWNG